MIQWITMNIIDLDSKLVARRIKLAEYEFVKLEVDYLIDLLKLLDDNQVAASIASLESLVAYLDGLSLKK